MSFDTYSDLQASIADHLDRDDLASQITDFIRLAEARHQREVRIREMRRRDTLTISEGSRETILPLDFLAHRQLRLRKPTGSFKRYFDEFDEVSDEELQRRSVNQSRTPRYYVLADVIEVDSEPDKDYTADLLYYSPLDALSDIVTTNDLLDRAPDVYLYASLLASAPFLIHDERLKVWGDLYVNARDTLNALERRALKSAMPVSRVKGPTP